MSTRQQASALWRTGWRNQTRSQDHILMASNFSGNASLTHRIIQSSKPAPAVILIPIYGFTTRNPPFNIHKDELTHKTNPCCWPIDIVYNLMTTLHHYSFILKGTFIHQVSLQLNYYKNTNIHFPRTSPMFSTSINVYQAQPPFSKKPQPSTSPLSPNKPQQTNILYTQLSNISPP